MEPPVLVVVMSNVDENTLLIQQILVNSGLDVVLSEKYTTQLQQQLHISNVKQLCTLQGEDLEKAGITKKMHIKLILQYIANNLQVDTTKSENEQEEQFSTMLKKVAPSLLTVEYPLSEEMSEFMKSTQSSRFVVVQKLWHYILTHKLYNFNTNEITNDDVLKKLFGYDKMSMLQMKESLNGHMGHT
jgi:hypothetical protein